MPLYLVKGLDSMGFCEAACHYVAETPKKAIVLFTADALSNPYTDIPAFNRLRLVATKSKADPAKMAVNWRTPND